MIVLQQIGKIIYFDMQGSCIWGGGNHGPLKRTQAMGGEGFTSNSNPDLSDFLFFLFFVFVSFCLEEQG